MPFGLGRQDPWSQFAQLGDDAEAGAVAIIAAYGFLTPTVDAELVSPAIRLLALAHRASALQGADPGDPQHRAPMVAVASGAVSSCLRGRPDGSDGGFSTIAGAGLRGIANVDVDSCAFPADPDLAFGQMLSGWEAVLEAAPGSTISLLRETLQPLYEELVHAWLPGINVGLLRAGFVQGRQRARTVAATMSEAQLAAVRALLTGD